MNNGNTSFYTRLPQLPELNNLECLKFFKKRNCVGDMSLYQDIYSSFSSSKNFLSERITLVTPTANPKSNPRIRKSGSVSKVSSNHFPPKIPIRMEPVNCETIADTIAIPCSGFLFDFDKVKRPISFFLANKKGFLQTKHDKLFFYVSFEKGINVLYPL